MYVFDTDVLSLLMKGRMPDRACRRLAEVPAERAATTAITIGELHYGAHRSVATQRWLAAIAVVLRRLRRLSFDAEAGRLYGELRARLEALGMRLDDADLRIASICVAHDCTLVTGNSRHFERVPGLRCENWLRDAPLA
jgi:tRNA(fMet)-specific endonuclease VapC